MLGHAFNGGDIHASNASQAHGRAATHRLIAPMYAARPSVSGGCYVQGITLAGAHVGLLSFTYPDFGAPDGLAVSNGRLIYVSNSTYTAESQSLVVADLRGRLRQRITHAHSSLAGVAVRGSIVAVRDVAAEEVRVFDLEAGAEVANFGGVGTADGEFSTITGIAVTTDAIFVACADYTNAVGTEDPAHDPALCHIQKFAHDGTFVAKWAATETRGGVTGGPSDIYANSSSLYVWYSGEIARMNILNFSGTELSTFDVTLPTPASSTAMPSFRGRFNANLLFHNTSSAKVCDDTGAVVEEWALPAVPSPPVSLSSPSYSATYR